MIEYEFEPTIYSGGTGLDDFDSNINNGPAPGTGYGGFSGDGYSYMDEDQYRELTGGSNYTPGSGVPGGDAAPDNWDAYSFDYEDPETVLNGQSLDPNSVTARLLNGEIKPLDESRTPIIKQNSKDDGGLLKALEGKLGDKTVAALITAGMGMLNGASQGKMLEKKWKREDDIRQQEIARKNANSKPGAVGKMTWTPANPQGTGLLGAKVG